MKITARIISPLGLGRQRQRTARQKGGARPKREVWARRSVYQKLLFIFRPRPGNEPVTPPFLIDRPLTEAEFFGAQELYVLQRRRRRDPFALSKPSKPGRDFSKIFPFLDQAAESGDWEAHRMIGRAAFASKPQRERERDARIPGTLAWSSTRGPLPRRKFLAKARRKLPPAKNRFSPLEVLSIATYRRGREFLWAFLLGEARALARDQGRPATADAPAQADTLVKHYPWLGLTADQIRVGLAYPEKQLDLDTAAKFHISPSYVRRLL